jgi:CHAD domain-containing protein
VTPELPPSTSPSQGSRPSTAAAPRRTRTVSAGTLLVRKLRALDAELAAAIPRVLASGKGNHGPADAAADEEAIHDLRVAIRRLRTLLKLARPVFGRHHADAVRAAFTVVHRATGALRDEEVLDETLDAIATDSPAFVGWKMRRRARERSLRRGVLARLRAGDLSRARELLKSLVTLPIDPERDRSAAKLARRSVERARRNVEALRDVPTSDAVGLHELRIAYKELRYATELLAPALPTDLAAMAEPAARFQKRLGEIHDADMALATLNRARGLQGPIQAEVRAQLEALREKRVGKYVAEMAPQASEAGDPDPAEHAEVPKPPASDLQLKGTTRPKRSASTRSGRSPTS